MTLLYLCLAVGLHVAQSDPWGTINGLHYRAWNLQDTNSNVLGELMKNNINKETQMIKKLWLSLMLSLNSDIAKSYSSLFNFSLFETYVSFPYFQYFQLALLLMAATICQNL